MPRLSIRKRMKIAHQHHLHGSPCASALFIDACRLAPWRPGTCRRERAWPRLQSSTVQSTSRTRWGDLLAAGAEIHEYQPTIYHRKVLIIDSLMGSVGSTNKVLEHAASLIGAQF